MADDKKNIGLEVETPTEAPAPGGPGSDPVLTAEEAAILEHEGQAALFEMGEFVPDPPEPFVGAPDMTKPVVADPAPAEKTAPVEKAESTVPEAPEPPKPDKEAKQTATPDKGDPTPAPSGKVVDFAAAREEAGKDKAPKQKAPKQKTTEPKDKAAAKASKGRPAKADKAAPDKAKPPTRDKMWPPRKTLRPIRRRLPPLLRRNSPPRPVTLPAQKKRKLSTSICPSCARSKTIPLVSGTMPKCRVLWSLSGQAA